MVEEPWKQGSCDPAGAGRGERGLGQGLGGERSPWGSTSRQAPALVQGNGNPFPGQRHSAVATSPLRGAARAAPAR